MPYLYAADQLQEVRRRINERTAANVSDRMIISLLNQGAYVATRDMGIYFEDFYGFPSAANTQEYSLPDNFISSSNILFSPWVTHQPLQQLSVNDILNPFPMTGDNPMWYAIDFANRKIFIAPIPEGSSVATTLNGAHNATVTTINVVSTVGMGQMGRVKIDSEVIQYTGATATTLTGCVRGADGTTAASHLTGAAVTWIDLLMNYQRTPAPLRIPYTTGTIAITTGTKTVTGASTNWLNGQNVYVGNYLGVGAYETTNSSNTFPMKWYKIASVDSLTGITLVDNYSEPTVTAGSSYIITDKSEIMDAETELPVLFAEIEIYHSMGKDNKKEQAKNDFAYEMEQAKKRQTPPDYIPTVRKTREAIDMTYPLPRMPGSYPDNSGSY